MNTQTMISVKMDKSLKVAAQKTAAEFGLPLGTMINAMLRNVVREKELNLSISERPSAYLRKAIAESERELALNPKPKGVSLKKMFEILNA